MGCNGLRDTEDVAMGPAGGAGIEIAGGDLRGETISSFKSMARRIGLGSAKLHTWLQAHGKSDTADAKTKNYAKKKNGSLLRFPRRCLARICHHSRPP